MTACYVYIDYRIYFLVYRKSYRLICRQISPKELSGLLYTLPRLPLARVKELMMKKKSIVTDS